MKDKREPIIHGSLYIAICTEVKKTSLVTSPAWSWASTIAFCYKPGALASSGPAEHRAPAHLSALLGATSSVIAIITTALLQNDTSLPPASCQLSVSLTLNHVFLIAEFTVFSPPNFLISKDCHLFLGSLHHLSAPLLFQPDRRASETGQPNY